MADSDNLPTKVTTRDVVVPTEQRGSLVARGLAAVQVREKQQLSLTTEADAEKLFRQGMRYRYGEDGTQEDDDKARECLMEAAKLAHAEAQYELAFLLAEDGDDTEYGRWLESSARLGFGPAQYQVGAYSELPENEKEAMIETAFAWYEERANAGDARRQFEFARIHLSGDVNPADRVQGLRWLKASAAQDYRQACRRLGVEYLRQETITENTTQQGIYWLSHAADLGDGMVCESLGDLYLLGHAGGIYATRQERSLPQRVTPDKNMAVAWYERGVELGWRTAAYKLGRFCLFGEHLDQNLQLAEKWLLHAATEGHDSAQILLGVEYASGTRLKRDADAAIHWLALASDSNFNAARRLAEIYRKGEIVPKDAAEAIKWLTKAAERNDLDSMRALGTLCASGEAGAVDQAAAQAWFERVVTICRRELDMNLRNPSRYAFVLASMYEVGEGVEKDQAMAIDLYKQAAAHHDGGALKRLRELGI